MMSYKKKSLPASSLKWGFAIARPKLAKQRIPEKVGKSSDADVLEDDPFLELLLRGPKDTSLNNGHQLLAPETAPTEREVKQSMIISPKTFYFYLKKFLTLFYYNIIVVILRSVYSDLKEGSSLLSCIRIDDPADAVHVVDGVFSSGLGNDIPEKVGKSSDADVLEDDPLLERLLRGATQTSINDSHRHLAPPFAATYIPEKVGKSSDADVLEDDPLLERLLRGATQTSVNDSHRHLASAFAATYIPEKVGKSSDAYVLEDDPLLDRLLRGATETSVNDSHRHLAPVFAATYIPEKVGKSNDAYVLEDDPLLDRLLRGATQTSVNDSHRHLAPVFAATYIPEKVGKSIDSDVLEDDPLLERLLRGATETSVNYNRLHISLLHCCMH